MMLNSFTKYRSNPRHSLPGDLMPVIIVAVTLLIFILAFLRLYQKTTCRMIDLGGKQKCYFYIYTGSDFKAVRDSLVRKGFLLRPHEFEWLSGRKHYDKNVRAGRYLLKEGMQNNTLVNLLRSGKQEPLRITIQNIRTPEDLAGNLGRRLETDSARLIRIFNDRRYLSGFGITPVSLFTLFIPNTYEFFWNTSGDQLMKRMATESGKFWNQSRKHRADSLGMSINEVLTMASIIDKETNKNEEKPIIAGVYINRLKKKIPLQADPTVIFAWHDFTIRRVLKMHTQIKSPYNTYLQSGLPPGPICLPSITSVDAVLHAKPHPYLYFCAKEDLSGYHNFAATLDEHNRNARRYQKALDTMHIK